MIRRELVGRFIVSTQETNLTFTDQVEIAKLIAILYAKRKWPLIRLGSEVNIFEIIWPFWIIRIRSNERNYNLIIDGINDNIGIDCLNINKNKMDELVKKLQNIKTDNLEQLDKTMDEGLIRNLSGLFNVKRIQSVLPPTLYNELAPYLSDLKIRDISQLVSIKFSSNENVIREMVLELIRFFHQSDTTLPLLQGVVKILNQIYKAMTNIVSETDSIIFETERERNELINQIQNRINVVNTDINSIRRAQRDLSNRVSNNESNIDNLKVKLRKAEESANNPDSTYEIREQLRGEIERGRDQLVEYERILPMLHKQLEHENIRLRNAQTIANQSFKELENQMTTARNIQVDQNIITQNLLARRLLQRCNKMLEEINNSIRTIQETISIRNNSHLLMPSPISGDLYIVPDFNNLKIEINRVYIPVYFCENKKLFQLKQKYELFTPCILPANEYNDLVNPKLQEYFSNVILSSLSDTDIKSLVYRAKKIDLQKYPAGIHLARRGLKIVSEKQLFSEKIIKEATKAIKRISKK